MDASVLKEYLVSLGFSVNSSELRKFDGALKDAGHLVEFHTSGITKSLLGWEGAVVGAFVGIGTAALGLADHVATTDQEYRLFGLQMFTTQETARKMKIALDTLGASMGEVAWDPELHKRFLQLIEDQKQWEKALGPDFEQNMIRIRDLRAEVGRFQVGLQYLTMRFVSSLFKALAGGAEPMQKLQEWFQWLIDHGPELADKFATDLVPVLSDAWSVIKELGKVIEAAAVGFMNLIGAISGDTSIMGADFKVQNLSAALRDLSHILEKVVRLMETLNNLSYAVGGVSLMAQGKWDEANELGKKINIFGWRGKGQGDAFDDGKNEHGENNARLQGYIVQQSKEQGLDPRLALSVAKIESGIKQFKTDGSIVKSGVGAMGVMQLMPETAKTLGVDATDAQQNIHGGISYLAQLLGKYKDARLALEAYNWGPGNVDKALQGRKEIPAAVQQYADSALKGMQGASAAYDKITSQAMSEPARNANSRMEGQQPTQQQVSIGDINVTVAQTNANPQDIHKAVQSGVQDALRRQVQYDQAQLAPVF